MMFLSSTFNDNALELAKSMVDIPVTIRLRREEECPENIKQYYIVIRNREKKYAKICGLVFGRTMIFCNTRRTASWLAEKMSKDGHAVALLSGELTVDQRMEILDWYKDGKDKVLITTNVLARGIDVEQVTMVVNYDLPMDQHGRADCETYLHRIGRTGRFGRKGLAINLIDSPQAHQILMQIKDYFGRRIENLMELHGSL